MLVARSLTARHSPPLSFAFLKVKISSIFAYRYLFTDDSFSTFLSLSFMLSAVLFTITVLTTQCIYETALTVKHVSNFLHEEIGGDVANKVDDVVRVRKLLRGAKRRVKLNGIGSLRSSFSLSPPLTRSLRSPLAAAREGAVGGQLLLVERVPPIRRELH